MSLIGWVGENWAAVAGIVIAVLGLIGSKKALQWRATVVSLVNAIELSPSNDVKDILKMQAMKGIIPKKAQSVLSLFVAGRDPDKRNPTLRQKIQVALLNKIIAPIKI